MNMDYDDIKWAGRHSEVTGFAAAMIASGHFTTVSDLQYFYEKPLKWSSEYHRWVAAGRPDEFDPNAAVLHVVPGES